MRRVILAAALGLGVCGIVRGQGAEPAQPSPIEIEDAISSHRLVNGMTLKEANKAMDGRPKFTRRGGVRLATWTRITEDEHWVWIAEIDEASATIWSVRGRDVLREELERLERLDRWWRVRW